MTTPPDQEKLTLRLPRRLHQRLRKVAANNGRSLNSEIVQRLRLSLEAPTRTQGSEQ
jgi:predicted HicB family RNase H-like nuclease